MKSGDYSMYKTALCHWVPRSLCNNTWCVTLVQAVPPFLNAWTEPKVMRWYEGRVSGRMFKRIWPSFLPFFYPSSFLNSLCLSFLLLSPPSSIPSYNHFFHSFCSSFSFALQQKKVSPQILFPCSLQDFRSAVAEAVGDEREPVLEEQRLGEILGVLPQVYTLHSSILTDLEERISNW